MPTLAAVVVPVRPDLSGFPGATRAQLENAFRQVTPTVEGAAKKHGGRFGTMFGTGVGETINSHLSPALAGVGDQFAEFAGAAAGPLAAVGAGVGLLAGQAVNMGVRTAASMEQAQIGFETLLGSGQKAQAFLTNLEQFAAATPFELPGLVESSRTLMGVGLDAQGTMAALQAFGNASSAVGVGQENFQRIMVATSQAIGAGRFMTEDLNQITENGIPIWTILSRAMGKPVPELRKLASAGKLMTSDVLPTLEKQMNRDYGGAMVRQSRSLSGVWSTFMDTLNIGMSRVLQPLIPLMTTGLTAATNVLGAALGVIPRLFSGAGNAGSAFSSVIANVTQWVRGDLIPAFLSVASNVLPAVQGALRSVASAFRDHQDVVVALGKVFQGLGLILTRVLIPVLGLVVTAVVTLVGPAIRTILTIVGAVTTAVGAVVGVAPRVASAGKAVIDSLVAALANNPVVRAIGAVVGAITAPFAKAGSLLTGHGGDVVTGLVTGITTGTLSRARNGLQAAISGVLAAITRPFGNADTALSGAGAGFVRGLAQGMGAATPEATRQATATRASIQGALVAPSVAPLTAGLVFGTTYARGLTTGFLVAGDIVHGFIMNTLNSMVALPARMLAVGVQTGANLAGGLRGQSRAVATSAGVLAQSIIGSFLNTPTWLIRAGVGAVTGLVVGIRTQFGGVSAVIGRLVLAVTAPFLSSLNWLIAPGVRLVSGLVNGVRSRWSAITGLLNSIRQVIIGSFTSAPSWLIAGGVRIVTGLLQGIRNTSPQVLGFVTGTLIRTYIRGPFASAPGWLISNGVRIVAGLVTGLRSQLGNVSNAISSGVARIRGAWNGSANWLYNIGFRIIWGFYQGLQAAWRSVTNWVGGIANWIRAHKGPLDLDERLLIPAGRAIMGGFLKGLQSGAGPAWSFVKSVGGKTVATLRSQLAPMFGGGGGGGGGSYGRGVSQWSSVVLQALQMLGQPASWLGTVLSRMQRESGGNPRAQNNWDINAQRGDPSKGLMQTISGTFNAYAGSLRGRGIWDPLANVYAGLNYAIHRYGSLAALSRPGGYDAGGWLPPGGIGMNLTGRPERVLDPQQSEAYARGGGLGGNVRVAVLLDGQVIDDRVHVIVEDAVGELGARIDNGIGG